MILEDLQRIRKEHYLDAYHIALLLDAMGQRDEAFEELERAYEANSYALLFSRLDAKADGLKSAPRFAPLWNRIFGVRVSAGV